MFVLQFSQLNLQQQNRTRSLLALVPKSGTRSEVDSSDTSADELENCFRPFNSDSSSPPPSLPSSLLDLNLLSDSDEELDEITHNTPALKLSSSFSRNISVSPSILSPRQSSFISLLQAAEVSAPKQGPPHSPLTKKTPVPSPLASTSSYCAPSPATATRSRKPIVVVTKKKVVKPKRLVANWRCQKFTGLAQVENSLVFPQKDKSPIEYFKCFFSNEIVTMIAQQTNLYSTQTKGVNINITEGDVQDFLAINLS